MRIPFALAATLLLAAGATAVTVGERTIDALLAEVVDLGVSFVVTPLGVATSTLGVAAAGTSSAPAELAVVPTTASPGVAAGNLAYSVQVAEATPAAVAGGTYRVELVVDGTSAGSAWLGQTTSDLLALEGARVSWDLGAAVPSGPRAYAVTVTPS